MGTWFGLLASAPATTTPDPSQQLRDSLHHLLLGLWPLWGLILLVGVVRVLLDLRRLRRLRRAGIFEIDRMTGVQFERRLSLLFRDLGYRADVVGSARGDFGGDLVVTKNGKRTVVQAKCWRKKAVGVKAVQEAVAAKAVYDADDAMVVTNSHFTKQARHLAAKNRVTLWGRSELVGALLDTRKVTSAPVELHPVLDVAPTAVSAGLAGETTAIAELPRPAVTSPSGAFCARCAEPVSVKVRDYCLAHPGRFGGLVYCFKDQRAFPRR